MDSFDGQRRRDTPWGRARTFQLAAGLRAQTGALTNSDPSWAWWTNLQPYRVEWTAQLTGLASDQLNAQSIECKGFWRAPELVVTNLSAELGGGRLDAGARLNVATREFAFTNSSCFDPRAIGSLLTEKTQNWLAQFSWTQPPALRAGGSSDTARVDKPPARLAGRSAANDTARW